MVLHKALDNNNGFIGYEAQIPRSTRSTRKRSIIWRKPEVNEQKCAFDLLATIAGNILLEEGHNSPSSANTSSSTKDSLIKKEKQNEEETLEHQPCDHGGYERRFFLSELVSQEHPLRDNAEHDTWPSALTTTSSDCSEKLELGSLNRKEGPDVSGTNVSSSCQLGFEFGNGRNDLDLKRQRSLKDYPFKKRKLYDDKNSVSISEAGRSNEDASSYTLTTGTPNPAAGESGSLRSSDSPVKLRIKSFRIPELFIEIPETATVGSLKRTVMEAVTTILGGGLRVGVLLQGKKVRDDSKTLLQSGICHDNNMLNAVGFTLEPNSSQDSPYLVSPKDHPFVLSRDSPEPLASVGRSGVEAKRNDARRGMRMINFIGSAHDSATSINKRGTSDDSRALVAVPNRNMDALAVAPPLRRPKRSETAQRRIRRPFSVSEVEALVQAVEKLGTGRWRDVKLRAFDNAKHRTYVDLKDKWKTLVHTARISPQQRRGEPVPQELLDRVLTAHAYWSQHHSPTCLLL